MLHYADQGLRALIGLDEEEYIPNRDRNNPDDFSRPQIVGQAQVTGAPNGLRMRDKPIDGNTVTLIPNNQVVGLGPTNTPGWAFVGWNNQYGYSSTDYLKPVGGPQDNFVPPPQPTPPAPRPPAPMPIVPPKPAPPPAPPPKPKGLSTGTKLLYAGLITGAVVLPAWLIARSH